METIVHKSSIAAVQSVMPVEVTQHREVRSISVKDPVGTGIFRRTLNIVTYFKQTGDGDEERGWLVAGWIKESLGRALTEQPMLCGRLRWIKKTEEEEEEDGLEVVPNDSGVRLVEARFPASLQEFFGMVKGDKDRAEAETVFWRDIDEVDPQFSPLFYVQVTNFESGGYSIGISCSILVADILLETDFLIKWAKIQSSLAHSQTTLKPIFYLPPVKRDKFINNELSRPAGSVLDRGEPLVFCWGKTCSKTPLACMKKSIIKATEDVFLYVKEQSSGQNSTTERKVVIHSRDEAIEYCDCGSDHLLEETDVRGVVVDVSLAFEDKLEFNSSWVGSVAKGVVLIVPSTLGDTKSPVKFIVASPKNTTH